MNKLQKTNTFIRKLSETFPSISDELNDKDYQGLVSLQIGVFRRFAQDSINRGDWKIVNEIFSFVNENIDKVEHKIENSLFISFLGKLDIPFGSKASELLPAKLKSMISDLREYENSRSKNENLNKFLDGLK